MREAKPTMSSIHVNGKRIVAQVTDSCVMLTVILGPPLDGESLTSSLRHGALDVKEHDSFTAAIEYLLHEPTIQGGDWDRVYIVNPERLRGRVDGNKK